MTRRSKKATTIYITELDYNRLSGLIDRTRESNGVDREYLNKLETELDRAEIVAPKNIPANVVTMRSQVRLKDLASERGKQTYSLVFPTEADFAKGKISVLAPIGTAILGYRQGDTIEWQVPVGFAKAKNRGDSLSAGVGR
jgi:regulator of nucleoside diphosphate kinase